MTPDSGNRHLGYYNDPSSLDLVSCRERIAFLEDYIERLVEKIREWPTKYRAEALFLCEDGKWAADDMDYDSFEHCIETQLWFFRGIGELEYSDERLEAFYAELDELYERVADS